MTPDNLHVTPHEKSVNICLVSYVLVLLSAHVQRLELEKAGSMGSAEPNIFQILRQICFSFRKIFNKFYQSLPKFTKSTSFTKKIRNFKV